MAWEKDIMKRLKSNPTLDLLCNPQNPEIKYLLPMLEKFITLKDHNKQALLLYKVHNDSKLGQVSQMAITI